MTKALLYPLTGLFLLFALPEASARLWADSTGKHEVEAGFVDFKDGKLRLKRTDGRIVAAPPEKLAALRAKKNRRCSVWAQLACTVDWS